MSLFPLLFIHRFGHDRIIHRPREVADTAERSAETKWQAKLKQERRGNDGRDSREYVDGLPRSEPESVTR